MSSRVLLGIKDDAISEVGSTNWRTNKIGGKPDWTPATQDVNVPQCQLCDRKMALVVQVYSPLGTSPYDRTLYVFCCIKPTCWNKRESWQVYRVQYLPPEENVRQETPSPAEDMWLSEELDWDGDSDDNSSQVVLSDKPDFNTANEQSFPTEETESMCIMDNCNPLTARVLEISRTAKDSLPWQPPQMPLVPPDYSPVFTPFFINVIEEPPMDKDVDRHVQQLLDSYQGKELPNETGSMSTESAAEMYEKNCVKHGDRTFQKFVNRVARCQQQIIRYCWKGEPLLMRNEPLPLICQHCGGPLVYELQLMPGLVNFLRLHDAENGGTAAEFGTVLIFTCQSSCWEGGEKYRTENICIQSDPEEELFQQMS